MNAKSKMVSFRLSAEEYSRLREAAAASGVTSLSELARSAMQQILDNNTASPISLHDQIRGLRSRVESISSELDRLTHLVSKTNGVGA